MNTLVLSAEDKNKERAYELLESGEIVAVPTETVYGLAANGLNVSAVRKIFEAKGRPQDNPLILHISSIGMLNGIAEYISPLALRLSESFWPGPLTMIFPKRDRIPSETCGGLDTVAVRMPNNRFTLSLIERCGFPLAAPSANTSGLPSPTTAKHVYEDMKGRIPLIIDGGECKFGVESTVITFESEERVRILRPGGVTAEMLREYADVVIDDGVLMKIDPDKRVLSPGMKYKHYSPKAEVFILNGSTEKIELFLSKRDECLKTAYLGYGNEKLKDSIISIPYGETSEEQAEHLFSGLRLCDELQCNEVYVRMPEKKGMGLAVYNRLLRSAGFRVIEL